MLIHFFLFIQGMQKPRIPEFPLKNKNTSTAQEKNWLSLLE